jgi:hypothetical protein
MVSGKKRGVASGTVLLFCRMYCGFVKRRKGLEKKEKKQREKGEGGRWSNCMRDMHDKREEEKHGKK